MVNRNLRHPNIVNLMGYFFQEEYLCLVEEFGRNGELRDYINQNKPLPTDHILYFAREIAQGLKYLHSRPKPIIHLDLKAENVLVRVYWDK